MNKRQERAETICKLPNSFRVIKEGLYLVRSQTNLNTSYFVKSTGFGLVCECPDHQTRKSDCKHIKVALKNIKENKADSSKGYRMMERNEVRCCPHCDSGNLKKDGIDRRKGKEIQLYECKDCHKNFKDNLGVENMRYDAETIARAMTMIGSKMSYREIKDIFKQDGISVSHVSVSNWIKKYANLIGDYTSGIVPRVSERWRTDELYVKFRGEPKWVYTMMDNGTRFMIAQQIADKKYTENVRPMFEMAKEQANMIPSTLISDGAPNFHESWKAEWQQRNPNQKMTSHIRHVHLSGDINNNMMERLNGTMRDWEKIRRGLKKSDSSMFRQFRIYYNFVKNHSGINNKTPAEESLIFVSGKNKWITLMQNASLEKKRNG